MPFKSEKQRRFLHANEPEVARKWEKGYASGGMLKKAVANNMKLQDYARLRSGGVIRNGTLTPGSVKTSDELCKQKFRDS